jgi:hypothetical protein
MAFAGTSSLRPHSYTSSLRLQTLVIALGLMH